MGASDTSLPPTRSPKLATTRALRALAPRERWTSSQWAENCRTLSEEESSEPGPYSLDRTPYWRFVLDLASDPLVEEIVCIKGAQIGWSEVCRNVFGYWVDLDPGPTMILMPDQKSAEDFKVERIDPLVKNTPAVRRHLTSRAWDDTKHRIRFDTMTAYFVWAGSKSGTKSRPIRRLICEEPDEYPPFSSTGGDPLSKAEKRLTTYKDKGRAKVLLGGTPTTRTGNITKRWGMCALRYHFWVPCPHCNGFQRLFWKQVKWPGAEANEERAAHAERVKSVGLAYYECEHCKGRIDDHHKPRMLRRGLWANEDQAVTVDGRIVGPARVAKRVGVSISGLYSPWVLFGQLASEWIEAQGDPNALADFINQRLAEPFEEQRQKTEPDFIRQKVQVKQQNGDWKVDENAPQPFVVPAWAITLVATADTQGNNDQDGYFWFTVRAWGYGYRSQLVDFGAVSSKDELIQRTINRQYQMAGGQRSVSPIGLWVDSGGPRWSEIYQLAIADQRIHPVKGSADKRTWMVDERVQRNRQNVVLWMVDTEQSKDLTHRLVHDPDRTLWMPHAAIDDLYCKQMSAEAKVFDPVQKREVWTEIVKKNNHFWDCEQYQSAVAYRLGCGMPDPSGQAKPATVSPESDPYNPLARSRRW
ncbi:MAG: phage terminase large subunit family protein [Tepidisphaeraceae bacterium]